MTMWPTSSREWIERLVAFDTTSARSNLELIDFVETYLVSLGADCRRSSDTAEPKANLYATLGPGVPGGIVLSGHSDVVPVDGQPWSSNPFKVEERDGRLYGRGTADMKSFLAVTLAAAPAFLRRGPARPLHLAISYDEEVGCLGVSSLIAQIDRELPRPALVIIGEPTSMQIVNAHKGVCAFETAIHGRAAHSSQPQHAANAILAAGRLVTFLGHLATEKRRAASADSRFDPPYTTFNIGRIEGGTALNIVASDCRVVWEFRPLPEDDPAAILSRIEGFIAEELLPRLRENAPEASIETRALARVPALRPEEQGVAEGLVRRLTGRNDSAAVAFGTEGGLFQEAGYSVVVCGPGSIDQAHRPDEFIDIAQVEACERFLEDLAQAAASQPAL
jgi:acetylornithine deacetylase